MHNRQFLLSKYGNPFRIRVVPFINVPCRTLCRETVCERFHPEPFSEVLLFNVPTQRFYPPWSFYQEPWKWFLTEPLVLQRTLDDTFKVGVPQEWMVLCGNLQEEPFWNLYMFTGGFTILHHTCLSHKLDQHWFQTICDVTNRACQALPLKSDFQRAQRNFPLSADQCVTYIILCSEAQTFNHKNKKKKHILTEGL